MYNKIFFRIISVLCALIGAVSLALTALMWFGAVCITPLGFLFGLGEMGSYTTLLKKSTNLWWHVAPGLAGGGLSLVFMILTALLLWGCISAWRHSNKTR